MKRLISLAIAFCLFAALSAPIAATQGAEYIQVAYRDIKIIIDGTQITPRDVTGAEVEPFLYKGTTYLPVRAVGEALNMLVSWDDATSTVFLDEQSALNSHVSNAEMQEVGLFKFGTETIRAGYRDIQIYINGRKITPKDATGAVVEPFIYNGTTYLPIRAIGNALNMNVSWDESANTIGMTPMPPEPDPTPSPVPTPAPTPSVPSTVYVTPTGKRYHYLASCAGKNAIARSINNVGGYTPCGTCVF